MESDDDNIANYDDYVIDNDNVNNNNDTDVDNA